MLGAILGLLLFGEVSVMTCGQANHSNCKKNLFQGEVLEPLLPEYISNEQHLTFLQVETLYFQCIFKRRFIFSISVELKVLSPLCSLDKIKKIFFSGWDLVKNFRIRFEPLCPRIYEQGHEKLSMPYANNKSADQLLHPCSLISTFVIRYIDFVILYLLHFLLVSVSDQTSLSLNMPLDPEGGFLKTLLVSISNE